MEGDRHQAWVRRTSKHWRMSCVEGPPRASTSSDVSGYWHRGGLAFMSRRFGFEKWVDDEGHRSASCILILDTLHVPAQVLLFNCGRRLVATLNTLNGMNSFMRGPLSRRTPFLVAR